MTIVHAKPPVLLILMLGTMSVFGALSINMYLPAIPAIGRALDTSTASIQQTVAAFMIGISSGQLVWGALSEKLGRRAPLFAGFGLYVAACIVCALAVSQPELLIARLVQGFGACSGMVLARAIVSDRFEGTQAAVIFSWQHLIMGVAPIFSPLIGAFILARFGWRAIFWLLAALALALVVLCWFRLAESRSEAAALRARSETRIAAYAALLGNPRALAHVLAMGLAAAPLMTWYSASSPLFEETFGWSAGTTAWLFGALGVLIVGATQVNRRLLRHFTPPRIARTMLATGATVSGAAALLVFLRLGGVAVVAVGLVASVSLYGFVSANVQASALGEDRARAGSLSALLGCSIYAVGGLMAWTISALPPAGGLSVLLLIAAEFGASWLILHRVNKAARQLQGVSA